MTLLAPQAIGTSDLRVVPLAFGGNVFGWTADQAAAFELMDAFTGEGGDFIDTADMYSQWHPGNDGGVSEQIIGEWVTSRKARDRVVIASKVAKHHAARGLAPENIRRAADASLTRLRMDHIDLYYAHEDDDTVPVVEFAAAFSELVDQGKVRAIGLSNFSGDRIREWCTVAREEHLHLPVALQPHYNLVERDYETNGMREEAERQNLGVIPYYSLAEGFLTGKYRSDSDATVGGASPRADAAVRHLNDRGRAVLRALDEVAEARQVSIPAVALAWLRAQPAVVAPIASARNTSQLTALIESLHTELSPDEVAVLTQASA